MSGSFPQGLFIPAGQSTRRKKRKKEARQLIIVVLHDLFESVENRLLFLERNEAARVQIDGSSPLLPLTPLMRQIAVTLAAWPGPLAQKAGRYFGYFRWTLLRTARVSARRRPVHVTRVFPLRERSAGKGSVAGLGNRPGR